MSRTRKDAKILNVKLEREIHDRLEQFCSETGMSKTTAVEKILNRYFDEYFSKPEQDRIII